MNILVNGLFALPVVVLLSLAADEVRAAEVTCQSEDGREAVCQIDTSGRVYMVRQLSKTACIEGQTWGLYRHAVWVRSGCRAIFSSGSGGSGYSGGNDLPTEVRCESNDGRQQECDMNTRGDVRLTQQLSKTHCVEGQNWGLYKHSVWVKDGCRAIFTNLSGNAYADINRSEHAPAYGAAAGAGYAGGGGAATVRCESQDRRQQECPMNTSGNVRVSRQLSKAPCTYGQTWGLFKHSVWVKDGCRAEFVNEGTADSHSQGSPPSAAVRGCNAVEDRYGQVVSHSALKRGYWEIILAYDDGQYVCNVSSNGKVSYFKKLHR